MENVKKELLKCGADEVIILRASKKCIEDWFLYDLDGIKKHLNINKSFKPKGKNGFEKMKKLYNEANKLYLKGRHVRDLVKALDIDNIFSCVKNELTPLYSIFEINKKN